MKRLFTILAIVFVTSNLLGQATWFGPNYVHLNTAANCFGDYTLLNPAIIGSNLGDVILFSHVWGVEGTHEEYMHKSCGLWHTGFEWSVFDETQQAMDTNYAFNVLNANTNGTGFTHAVTSANLIENFSLIDHPLLNGHPERIFFISKTWMDGVYDTAHVGIWYDEVFGQWTIYNEAAYPQTLELNSTYNIFIPDTLKSCFKHVATDSYYTTTLDDARINGNPNARIFVVHDYTTSSTLR